MNAHFVLAGRDTTLQLTDAGGRIDPLPQARIDVQRIDGVKFSFLDNVLTSSTEYHGPHGTPGTSASYLPHFVLAGQRAIGEPVQVAAVSFTTDDAADLFYDFDAFSIDIGADRKRMSEIVADRQARIGRATEIGERPIIAYFTGKFDIVSASCAGLRVTARHQPSHGMGGPKGVAIRNKIRISLEFEAPQSLGGSIDRLLTMLRFLQIVAGRKQAVSDLQVREAGAEEHEWHALHWCLAWSGEAGRKERPNPGDMPINGGIDPAGFASVLAGWFSTEESAIDARVRFARSFEQGRTYGPDRLVAAANMFDLLPSQRFNPPIELNEEERSVREQAIKLFKALPASEIRDRALGDLGRLGNHNLKSRVMQRAALVLQGSAGRLAGLEVVLPDAIDARNHFVHGTKASPKRARLFRDNASFYIRCLEATFGLSELMECGWNFAAWCRELKGQSHPFTEFLVHFQLDMAQYHLDRQLAFGG